MRHCDDVTSKELLITYITLEFNLSTAPQLFIVNYSLNSKAVISMTAFVFFTISCEIYRTK